MKKIIPTLIIIAILGALTYFFAYPIIRDRYFQETTTVEDGKVIIQAPEDSDSPEAPVTENPTTENEPDASPSEEIIQNSIENSVGSGSTGATGNIRANITPTHCADNCRAFASDLVLFAYCEQVCGISPIKTDAADCDAKKDLEKDYCLKDLAVTKSDATLCKPIADDNIRKTCQNRIAEDLLEKIQSGNNSGL